MRVLVLGGAGFLGRHVVAALAARGHAVTIGSRDRVAPARRVAAASRAAAPASKTSPARLPGARCSTASTSVVNCVGILRERGARPTSACTTSRPAALARRLRATCGVRLVHVSALGLDASARSGFIRSKLRGEARDRARAAPTTRSCGRRCWRAKAASARAGCARSRAGRCIACRPMPSGASRCWMSSDAGFAIARSCELPGASYREVELGGARAAHAGRASRRAAGARRAGARRARSRARSRASRATSATCCTSRRSRSAISSFCAATTCRAPNLLPALLGAPPRRIGAVHGMAAQQRLREVAPAFRRAQSAMVEVHRARERGERRASTAPRRTRASGTPRS